MSPQSACNGGKAMSGFAHPHVKNDSPARQQWPGRGVCVCVSSLAEACFCIAAN